MKAIFFLCFFILSLMVVTGCDNGDDKIVEQNIFRGHIDQYGVQIEDTRHGHQKHFERIVRLLPTPTNKIWHGNMSGYIDLGITGYDYDDDGHWDRVFYCGYPELSDGCNSVLLDANARITVWEPCLADENRLEPFTQEQVDYAVARLNEAMKKCHNEWCRRSSLRQVRTQQS